MKKVYKIFIPAVLVFLAACTTSIPIETKIPPRPAGQEDMLAFAAPALDTVRVGFIGLGMRGPGAVRRFTHIPGIQIVALCDKHEERVDSSQNILINAGFPQAAAYSGSDHAWKELCDREDIDLVYIATDWQTHAQMAVYAMEQGKHVAVEVPGAMDLDEIWNIINTSEKTRKHCMMLENCVYDFFELTTLYMAQQGLFGEILHGEGAYIHNLEDFWDHYEGDWRMEFNRKFSGDVYATHGLGPVCQALDIHRGDKMDILVAMDTKSVNIPEFLIQKRGVPPEEAYTFENGQNTMTIIRTQNGKTIHIQHDVSSPRPYSRMYQLSGTKGFATKYPVPGYALEIPQATLEGTPNLENLSAHRFVPEEIRRALMEQYKHPIQAELEEQAKMVGGHGGMDFIMDYRLVYCLRNGLPLDMDVYDLAEWSCIGALGRISIENGNAPVRVPDFTRGGWNKIQGYRHAMVSPSS